MNPIAKELNKTIKDANPYIFEMLSDMGKSLFFPKGILSQSAEAKEKAFKINATIGIAKENNHVLSLNSITKHIHGIEPDEYLPYAPSFGIPALRKKWQSEIYRKNPGLEGKAVSLPVVTSGITHGISLFSDLWIDKDDVIILPDMFWGNYNLTFCVRNSGRIVHYKAYDEELTRFNLESFEQVLREQAKLNDKLVVILNFPHNPTGYSLSVSEAEKAANIIIDLAQKGTKIVVGCDDAYFGLFFDDEINKESIFSKLAGADEKIVAVKLDGATKEDYVWGFRTAFITYGLSCGDPQASEAVYEALEKKTAGCIRGNISNASHLSQTLLLKSMADENYEVYKKEKYELLKSRAQKMKEVLKNPKYAEGFDVYPFNSGYFMCIRLKDVNAEQLRLHLLDKYGTGLISIGDKNIRIAFSCLEVNDVEPLFDIILSGIQDIRETL